MGKFDKLKPFLPLAGATAAGGIGGALHGYRSASKKLERSPSLRKNINKKPTPFGEGLGPGGDKKLKRNTAIAHGITGASIGASLYGAKHLHGLRKEMLGKFRGAPSKGTKAPEWLKNIKSKAEASKAFKNEAKKHHPDRGGDVEKFKTLSTEWENFQKSDSFKKMGAAMHAIMKHVSKEAPKAEAAAKKGTGAVKKFLWKHLRPSKIKRVLKTNPEVVTNAAKGGGVGALLGATDVSKEDLQQKKGLSQAGKGALSGAAKGAIVGGSIGMLGRSANRLNRSAKNINYRNAKKNVDLRTKHKKPGTVDMGLVMDKQQVDRATKTRKQRYSKPFTKPRSWSDVDSDNRMEAFGFGSRYV